MLSLTKCMAVARAAVPLGARGAGGSVSGSAAADGPTTPIATSYIATGHARRRRDSRRRLSMGICSCGCGSADDRPWCSTTGVRRGCASGRGSLGQPELRDVLPQPDAGPGHPPGWASAHDAARLAARLQLAQLRVARRPAPRAHDDCAGARGVRYAGPWSIPVIVNGRLSAVSGGVWHANPPSLLWFWPIAVIIACVLAAWRLRLPALDQRMARWLAVRC